MRKILSVHNISKRYQIGSPEGAGRTLREALTEFLKNPINHFKSNGHSAKEFWALKNISFEVGPGEIIGVIGDNGAGKSTLFKILSRVVEPTSGRAELYGKVSSLLEVGTGFHPELTGRENVFLNGSILGMSRREIKRKFDEIVAFSEIDKFLDTPVKRYSSGMYMRLAFAVAAHLEPEILLVDEVLAVGDASFQKKCLGKIGEVASEGRTVLFVSHSMTAISALCKRAIWLEDGKIVEEAETAKVVSDYIRTITEVSTEKVWNDPASAPGNDRVRLHRVCVRPVAGSSMDDITIQTAFVLEFDYWNLEPGAMLSLSIHLLNEQGTVFNTFPIREPDWHRKPFPIGLFRSVCYVPGNLLNDGRHRVLLLIVRDQADVIFSLPDALVFEILESVERRGDWHGDWTGAVRPDLQWETQYLDEGCGPMAD